MGLFGKDEEVKTTLLRSVTLDAAKVIIDAACERAGKIGVPMNIAVVDAGTNLVAFARMDGAWIGSIGIAQDKAFTSRAFDIATKELSSPSQPGKPMYGIESTLGGRVVIFAGGIPLKDGGKVIGAVGVSGGMPDQDHDVASAGVDAFDAGGESTG